MKRSTSHILTTHTGSLPRAREHQELLRLREERRVFDQSMFAAGVRAAVDDIVQQQIAIGLDVMASKDARNMRRMSKSASPALKGSSSSARVHGSAMPTSPIMLRRIRVPPPFPNPPAQGPLPGRIGRLCSRTSPI